MNERVFSITCFSDSIKQMSKNLEWYHQLKIEPQTELNIVLCPDPVS